MEDRGNFKHENDMIKGTELQILKVHAKNSGKINAKTVILKIPMRKCKGADKERVWAI